MHEKIFIIGLPRTGTTSVCCALLELGFKTAHTCYTERAMQQAQVIADTPVFHDFELLVRLYPQAKFIYLARELDKWLPSIKQLLQRMSKNLLRTDGGFNPIIKRCYQEVFSPFTLENVDSDEFLTACYQKHNKRVQRLFELVPDNVLQIDVADTDSYGALISFLNMSPILADSKGFVKMNIAGKVTAWKDINHPLKIESTRDGRVDKLWYSLGR